MADQYGTQLDTMQQASSHVRDVNQQIQVQLSSLQSRLEPLASTWKGSAAVSYHSLQARWNDDAQKLNRALSDIAEAIVSNRSTYQQSDESHSASFSNITSALG